jgi:hypothetical protein
MLKIGLLAFLLSFPLLAPQDHKGQPAHCDNAAATPAEQRCECNRADLKCKDHPGVDPEGQPNEKCKTYCKPEHCECANPCNS